MGMSDASRVSRNPSDIASAEFTPTLSGSVSQMLIDLDDAATAHEQNTQITDGSR